MMHCCVEEHGLWTADLVIERASSKGLIGPPSLTKIQLCNLSCNYKSFCLASYGNSHFPRFCLACSMTFGEQLFDLLICCLLLVKYFSLKDFSHTVPVVVYQKITLLAEAWSTEGSFLLFSVFLNF